MKSKASLPMRIGSCAALALATALGTCALASEEPGVLAVAATSKAAPGKAAKAPAPLTPQAAEYSGPTEVAAPLQLTVGKSSVVRLSGEAVRLSVGSPDIADVLLINPREIYVLGKKPGSTNVFVWTKRGPTTVMDVLVSLDTANVKARLATMLPGEAGLHIESVGDSIVLSGHVTDAVKAQRVMALAEAYAGKKVVNLLNVEANQQVMLEVKVAEVSKTLLDRLGVDFNLVRTSGGTTFTLLANLLSSGPGSIAAASNSGRTTVTLDAEVKNGLVKILAEPTIMAISGQEGAFLAGGKVFIPVPQSGGLGTSGLITLEEKEFGVGLRFTPTVLDDGRINLRVTPEVSELSELGTPVRLVSGQTNILPFMTTRRASTTVQLRDGESFVIGGLIKSNITEAVRGLPILGQLPVLGALFRSTEFTSDRSELLFIVTPRLVKPLAAPPALPTDAFREPTQSELLLEGRLEGRGPANSESPSERNTGGFHLR